jgi:hypothetical protein
MPAAGPSANPFRNSILADAARDGMLISVTCLLCRRTVNYWAEDLVRVVGPMHQRHLPPFPCSRCRTAEHMAVRWCIPTSAEREKLMVRRPVKQVVKWVWRNERA